jgi:hypothetical protein
MKPLISNVDVSGRKRPTHSSSDYKALTASLREQAAQIQKVSAQLATASPSLADLK